MGRHLGVVTVLLDLMVLSCANDAAAQPELWATGFARQGPTVGRGDRVTVTDVSTGSLLGEFVLPAGICVGRGGMSPDGRSFIVPDSKSAERTAAVLRIDTATKQIVELVPTTLPDVSPVSLNALDCGSVTISPSSRWWYVVWQTPEFWAGAFLETIDTLSRLSTSRSSLWADHVAIVFDPQGHRRFELHGLPDCGWPIPCTEQLWALYAYADGEEDSIWIKRPLDKIYGQTLAAGPDGVYLITRGELVRYDAATGAVRSRIGLRLPAEANALTYYNGRVYVSAGQALASFDAMTLAPGPVVFSAESGDNVHFDALADVGYWHRQVCVPFGFAGRSMSCTHYLQPFDPATLTLSPPRQMAAAIGGGSIAEQFPPGPVTLTDQSSRGDRVTLAWLPDPSGTVPTTVEIWRARAGESAARAAVVPPTARSWTSPPLMPGSYGFVIVARNGNGFGPPAHLAISVDDPLRPPPPAAVEAAIADRAVKITWEPGTASPAPDSYVVEAAPAGSVSFGVVGRTSIPRFSMADAPPGTWQLRVRAHAAGGSSEPSEIVTVTTTACTAAPAAPSALASLVSANIVTLAWRPPASGDPLEYVVEAGSRDGLTDLTRLIVGTATASYEIAAPAAVYAVRVRARNACGESAPSNEVVVRVP
jgi:hypothetical protein